MQHFVAHHNAHYDARELIARTGQLIPEIIKNRLLGEFSKSKILNLKQNQ